MGEKASISQFYSSPYCKVKTLVLVLLSLLFEGVEKYLHPIRITLADTDS